ncbi:RDD family protein [Pontibacter sp. G13]|uniref:RDD family protein n=1 Tax=Pontibacter sp. G13 TaxID=3074898 RepID=UPI00288B4216|nr:RDD family protein [Pontibacter sp. G13]WNJ18323.1 RDD family protein [Pontibacter sp. G13]
MNEQPINAGTRLISMFTDHIAMSMLAMIFALPGMITTILSSTQADGVATLNLLSGGNLFAVVGFAFYFLKDSIDGRGLGKRMFKMQVVVHDTGETAGPLRCMVRNVFTLLWPIEAIMVMASPKRRLGDFVAGTSVELRDPEKPLMSIAWGQIGLAWLASYLVLLAPLYFLQTWVIGS